MSGEPRRPRRQRSMRTTAVQATSPRRSGTRWRWLRAAALLVALVGILVALGAQWLGTAAAPPCGTPHGICPPTVDPPTIVPTVNNTPPPTAAPTVDATPPPTANATTAPTVAPTTAPTTAPGSNPTTAPISTPAGGPPRQATATPAAGGAGGLASAARGAAASGSTDTSDQLRTALLSADALGTYTPTDTASNTSGVICGIDIRALPPAVQNSYVSQIEAGFVGSATGNAGRVVRITLVSFDGANGAAAFLQQVATRYSNSLTSSGAALAIAGATNGDLCLLAQQGNVVIAVHISAGDPQSASDEGLRLLRLQLQRLQDFLAGNVPQPSAPPATTSTPTATPTPAASSANGSPPTSGSDEDPPQPSL
jgi:hypothetical protein